MPGNAISWWLREPSYLIWGDRAVVSKLLVGRFSTVAMPAGFYDKLGRGINWKWGKVSNEKKVLFHRAHNCVCHSCHRVLKLSGVQGVLISDSTNWWKRKRHSFCLQCPALQFDEKRDQQGKSHHIFVLVCLSLLSPQNWDLHCPGLWGSWLWCKATFRHNS